MAKKEFKYRGKTLQELKEMSIEEFANIVTSRVRRSLKRGFTDSQKALLKRLDKGDKDIKTHARNMIIIPKMVGTTIRIHNGKEFVQVIIDADMVGHFLGEFALTRKHLTHSAPGIGATKSSSSLSVK